NRREEVEGLNKRAFVIETHHSRILKASMAGEEVGVRFRF
ncbi:MAG: hypothetical protein ACI9S9_001716, partial [Planctomycetota bacterium]